MTKQTPRLSRRTFIRAAGGAGAVTLGAPAILSAQPAHYVIGASLPMTGPFATAGKMIAPALKIFEAFTNEEGGIGGVPIKVIVEDTGYIPQNGLANYQRLLATEGKNLIGYYGDSTGFMKLVAPELKGDRARLMASTSFASDLADRNTNPYQFMAGPTYQDQFDILLQNIRAKGGSTVAFVHSNTEFGADPIEYGKKRAEELGIKVVLVEITKPQGADIPTHVTKLAQADAEYCILQGYVTGVWPQLIGGARKFGLKTKFMGTFWGMEKIIADRVTDQAGPFLDGYQGVMPYRYFYDNENAPRYKKTAAFSKANLAGTPLENYLPTWGLQCLCSLELLARALHLTAEAGKELTADNASASLLQIKDYDTGGFFGEKVTIDNNKIGLGRVYEYSAQTKLFSPVSDWLKV